MAICKLRSITLRKRQSLRKRRISGRYFTKWCWDLCACIARKLFIGILSVLMCFLPRMAWLNWVILMSQRLRSLEFYKLKLELHTTQAQKFGRTSLTTINLTFGHLVVSFMSWLLSTHHSQQKT